MRKFIFLTVFLFMVSFAYTQERIAVFPFEILDNAITNNEAYQLYSVFTNQFTNISVGRLYVVPRQEVDKLINKEANFQLSDFFVQKKTAEMMKVENANQILSALIGKVGNSINITVSLYTYPNLIQLPGGVDRRVANANELFDIIPGLVQDMQNAIAGGNANNTVRTGIVFEGYVLNTRNRQNIISGLRDTIQSWKINLNIDEKTNAAANYGFTITINCESFITNGIPMLRSDVTVTFSRYGRLLCKSIPYRIIETDENMTVRRIAENINADKAFFDKVKELIRTGA